MWVWQSLRKQETEQDDEKGKKKGSRTPDCVAPQSGEGTAGPLLLVNGATSGGPGDLLPQARPEGLLKTSLALNESWVLFYVQGEEVAWHCRLNFCFFFIFFFPPFPFFGCTSVIWKFLGQGLNHCRIFYPTALGWGSNSRLHSDSSHCSQIFKPTVPQQELLDFGSCHSRNSWIC